MRVEWFRGRARYERWEEEEQILCREMASVVQTFDAAHKDWLSKADSDFAAFAAGYRAYCSQQSNMWCCLRDDALLHFLPALKASLLPIPGSLNSLLLRL